MGALRVLRTHFAQMIQRRTHNGRGVGRLNTFMSFTNRTILCRVFTFRLLGNDVERNRVAIIVSGHIRLLRLFFHMIFRRVVVMFTRLSRFRRIIMRHEQLGLTMNFFARIRSHRTHNRVLVVQHVAKSRIYNDLSGNFISIENLSAIVGLGIKTRFSLKGQGIVRSFYHPVRGTVSFIRVSTLYTAITLYRRRVLVRMYHAYF